MGQARRLLPFASAMLLVSTAALPSYAQQAPSAAVEDANALVRRMEERLQALDRAARERDQALGFLAKQVEAAQGAIDGGGQAESALRQGAAALSTRLDAVAEDRERLSSGTASDAVTIESLQQQLAALGTALGAERSGRADAQDQLASLRGQLDAGAQREQALVAGLGQKEQALAELRQQLAALDTTLGIERTARADAQGAVTALRGQLDAGAQREQALTQSVEARDKALAELQERIAALDRSLGAERADAQGQLAALREQLGAGAEREQVMTQRLGDTDKTVAGLQQRVAMLDNALAAERTGRSDAESQLAALREQLGAGAERERTLTQGMGDREKALAELQQQIAALGTALGLERSGHAAAASELAALHDRLAADTVREKTQAAEHERAAAELQRDAEAKAADIARLGGEVAGLRAELQRMQALLGGEQQVTARQETQIASLSGQLKAAMESQIQELSQYRSEFFGRLRQALGDRADVRVVGDRFVFQAEVLFGSGSAKLGPAGGEQLRRLARSLEEVASTIPADVPWILRVDGHTDRVPISNELFRSNWELSAARAIAVVDFLVRQGIPPERLAAAGFGEYQPLEGVDDEIAYRRNRRIEFKLTER